MTSFYVQVNYSDDYISEVMKKPTKPTSVQTIQGKDFEWMWSFSTTKSESNAKIFNDNDEFVKDHANAFGNDDLQKIYLP